MMFSSITGNSFSDQVYAFYFLTMLMYYSETCLKWPLKNRQNEGHKTGGSLVQDKSIAECSTGAFCNTFDLH